MTKANENNTPRLNPSPRLRWFHEGELTCAVAGCERPNPPGYYGKTKWIYLCSATCWNRHYLPRRKSAKCTFCRIKFKRLHTQHSKPFCSIKHYYLWRRKQTDEVKSGHFAPLLHEFIEDCAIRLLAPASINSARCSLSAFFYFLRRKKIRSLEKVVPKVITLFVAGVQKTRRKSAGRVIGDVRLFFDWLIVNGRRKSGNPVIPRFHSQKYITRLPRPYAPKDLQIIRALVEEAGDLALPLAIAIGEEAGLRLSEVCNLRLADVDLEKQQLFIRLPNKTTTERFAPFHNRAKAALIAWLKERPEVGHDYLFVGTKGIPLRKHTLRLRLNRVLCGPGKLDKFSFHRLRHNAASTVYPSMDALGILQTFGWKSEKVMGGYTRVLPETLRASYHRAMDQVSREGADITLQPESIEAYFAAQATTK